MRVGARLLALTLGTLLLAACAHLGGPGARDSDAAPKLDSSSYGDFLAGRYAESVHDSRAAAGYFAAALKNDRGDPMLQRATMLLLVRSGQVAKAAPYAREILIANPHEAAANLVTSVLDFHARNFAGAKRSLARVPETGLDGLVVPLLTAWADVGEAKGNPVGIDRALARVAGMKGGGSITGFAAYYSALINDVAGRTGAAEASYRTAMSATGNGDPLVIEAYASFLSRQHRFAAAANVLDAYLRQNEDTPLRTMLMTVSLHHPLAPLVDDARHGAAQVFYDIASALPAESSGDTRPTFAQMALYLRPAMTRAKVMLAEIYDREGRLDDALAVYRSIDPGTPYGEDAQISTAWLLNRLNKPDEAEALLEKLADSKPVNLVDVRGTLGDILRDRGRYEDAVGQYSAALAAAGPAREGDWSLYYSRGIAYDQMKDWPKAEADFQEALKLEPDQPMVLNYLGYSWIVRGEHMSRALDMIRQAVALRPRDGYIVDSLGWALYRLGRYHESVQELEQAVRLVPADPTINEHLGDAYWRVGRRLEARYQWRRALAFKPAADRVDELKRKIAEGLGRADTIGRPDAIGRTDDAHPSRRSGS